MQKLYKYTASTMLITLLFGCSVGEKGSKGSSDTIHNQGKSCINCHDFNGATVFNDLHAADNTAGVAGYRVQLGGADVYTTSSNGIGNSRYYGPATLSTFTAHVIDNNGNIVRSSAMNSHDSTRLDCNRCHTSAGTNGAPGRLTP